MFPANGTPGVKRIEHRLISRKIPAAHCQRRHALDQRRFARQAETFVTQKKNVRLRPL